ncbi:MULTISPECIES: amidohydrolase family protein [Leptospira]|uniref:Amidohydrolase family protein n=1 Tax=Leptospira interrogans serovar Bataviae TaxID=312175 RepID=A0AAP9WL50_LEPIR|nr:MULTISPECIES: amidohydrolase family protein [Leptospira]EMN71103.1 amidohydrolase family protein [Leptospira interrogans serovar Bataviae str. UI 08561]EKP04885.1 amidohydrolase family protein [Leptospira kirschneri str. 2008720114]EKR24633.1 amidohydrolase family protein [Leptospira interrogans serovar Bataviae str. L1111]MCR8647616.1 amidohydrolase [Leptospira interrogans serovar Bataviae]OAM73274.1 amidohydrolase [Leptospira interrogans serovar Bataviae]
MKIFDFNIHLPSIIDRDVNVVINQDLKLSPKELIVGVFERHKEIIGKVDGINVLLFNSNSHLEDISEFKVVSKKLFPKISYTSLVNFRCNNLDDYMHKLVASGSKAIIFNSYLQAISEEDFFSILQACKIAEKNDLIICIDGSFGTSKMFKYDNLKLACFIADHITKTPIIIVHSGGKRILEVMLLALSNSNVWLDTSFSLPFYIGSSVELDFAFAYKKIGCDRIVFGSDSPYCVFDDVVKMHFDFFEKHKFSTNQIENIMYKNSISLFDLE